MDFKTFFIKKVMMSFFVSITCICIAMALIGMIFQPNARFGYEAFLSPLIFGALTSLPLLAKYSKRELSVRQAAIRNGIHFLLIELVVLSVLYIGGMLTSVSIAISLGVSIFVIDLTVNLVLWIHDNKTAKIFNDALKRLQKEYGAGE